MKILRAIRSVVAVVMCGGLVGAAHGQCLNAPTNVDVTGPALQCATTATVTWTPTPGSIAQDVARGASADPASATVIATLGGLTATFTDNTPPTVGTVYYFVRARGLPNPQTCPTGISEWSAPAQVGLSVPITTAPAAVSVQSQTCTATVLQWGPVAGATSYELLSSTAPEFASATSSAVLPGSTLNAAYPPATVVGKYWWVRATNLCGVGPVSTPTFIAPAGGVSITGVTFRTPSCDRVTVSLDGTNPAVTVDVLYSVDGRFEPVSSAPATATSIVSGPIPGATAGQTVELLVRVRVPPCTVSAQVFFATGVIGGVSGVSVPTVIAAAGQPATISGQTTPAAPVDVTYSWTKDGQPLTSDGGRITGLSTPVLSFATVKIEDVGAYELSVGLCGSGSSVRGTGVLAVRVPCRADFDQSGAVSVQDVFAYLAGYFAGCP